MDEALLVLGQIGIMFIFIAVGYILKAVKLIPESGGRTIGNILVYAVVPCVIINAFMIERTTETMQALGWSFLLAAISLIISIGVSFIVFRKRPAANFSSAFSNAAFIGIPLITGVLGSQYVIYVTGLVVLVNVLQFTYGQHTLCPKENKINIKNIILNPLVIATILGVIIFFTQVPIPGVIGKSISGISALNSPLAMFVLGIYLRDIPFKKLFTNLKSYLVTVFRLIVIPLIVLLAIYFIPCPPEIKIANLICSAAPVGSNVVVFSAKNNLKTEEGIIYVLVSTILCIVTLPLFMFLITSII